MIVRPICRPVCRPVCEPLTAPRRGGGGAPDAWETLAALLAANSALWRPQVGYCWQDTGRTTPAGIGDPVRVIDDVSGNGLHAVAPADANRGTLAEVDIGGTMYQHVVFDGTDTRYAISMTVTQRTLVVAFDDDAATGFKGVIGTGSLNDILNINGTTWGSRVAGASRVDTSGLSSQDPRALIHRCSADTQTLQVDGAAESTLPSTPSSVTFATLGANTSLGSNPATGKFFGGLIMPAYADDTLRDTIQTFMGALIGKTL